MKRIKTYNESVSDFLKPKSEDDIRKSIKDLTPYQKLKKGVYRGMVWLVEESIKEGADPSHNDNELIKGLIMDDHYNDNIIDILNSYDGGVLTEKSISDGWFVHFETDDEKQLEELIKNDKIILGILLCDDRVLKKLTAIEIMGYRSLLGLN